MTLSIIHSEIISLANTQHLSAYSEQNTLQGIGKSAVNKTDEVLPSKSLCSDGKDRETIN